MIVVPFCSLVPAVVIAQTIVGPIGWKIGDAIAAVVHMGLTSQVKWLFAAVFGLTYAPIVMTGLHHMTNAIDPRYGAMEDFEELARQAEQRGICLMLDMVFNHTSTEHIWFRKALAGDPVYQAYYIFRPARPDGSAPTNWQSKFGGSTWEYAPQVGKYYLHLFNKTQADLNWETPAVRREVQQIVRFWMDKGVEGFRFDDEGEYWKESAKMLAGVIHGLRGTPYVYQGEVLGMTNAGFTTGTPWIGVTPNTSRINAASQVDDPDSIFAYYKALIRLRKEYDVFAYGDFAPVDQKHPSVLAYRREYKGQSLLCVNNFYRAGCRWHCPVSLEGYRVLLSNYSDNAPSADWTLRPYESVLLIRESDKN